MRFFKTILRFFLKLNSNQNYYIFKSVIIFPKIPKKIQEISIARKLSKKTLRRSTKKKFNLIVKLVKLSIFCQSPSKKILKLKKTRQTSLRRLRNPRHVKMVFGQGIGEPVSTTGSHSPPQQKLNSQQ